MSEPKDQGSVSPPTPSAGAPAIGNGASSAVMPDAYALNLLIRTTIVALNQANATGNYTVLRDLSAPGFQQANNPARLAEIFANIRNRNLDLSPILFFEPKLVRPPAIQPNGHLRLSGFFETLPEQVRFDMAFERGARGWALFGIALEVAPPATAAASTPDATAAPAAAAEATKDEPPAAKKVPAKVEAAKTAPAKGAAKARP